MRNSLYYKKDVNVLSRTKTLFESIPPLHPGLHQEYSTNVARGAMSNNDVTFSALSNFA